MGIALGSASQIALFVAPVLVLLSYVIGPTPMDLRFWPGAMAMMLTATLTAALVTNSGKSTWFVGVLVLMIYWDFRDEPVPPPAGDRVMSRRVLDPSERIAEVLFGLIMVLTFTGSLSIAEAGRDDVRAMLIGALGCNIAWGVIDGVLYLMSALAEKGRALSTYVALRRAATPTEAHQSDRRRPAATRRVGARARRDRSRAAAAAGAAGAARKRAAERD